MQKDISDRNTLGETFNPYDNARRSTAVDTTASNHNDTKEKVQKLEISLTWENMVQIWQNLYLESQN